MLNMLLSRKLLWYNISGPKARGKKKNRLEFSLNLKLPKMGPLFPESEMSIPLAFGLPAQKVDDLPPFSLYAMKEN